MTMDLKTLIEAQLELMGSDMPAGSCSTHGKTKREVVENAIKFLQEQLTGDNIDESSEYGYRIHVEIFKKGKPRI